MKALKRLHNLFGFLLCLATIPALATTYHWTGAVDTDWFNGGNWSKGTDPDPWPRSGDTPRMGINATIAPVIWPHYNGDNSASPTTGAFLIASTREAWFYLDGGNYLHSSWVNIGNGGGFTGHWLQTGGSFNNATRQFSIGEQSVGDFQISGGSLVTGDFRLSTTATGSGSGLISGNGWVEAGQAQIGMYNTGTLTIQDDGRLQLDTYLNLGNSANGGVGFLNLLGGKVYVDNLSFNTSSSTIRLDGGTLQLGGDETANAADWIANGNLFTTIEGQMVTFAYDPDSNRTTFISAVPEPATASFFLLAFLLATLRSRRNQSLC